jgi:curved DNA-binding protein CbpA
MGNISSVDQTHVSIYKKLLLIKNYKTRVQTIQTLLAGNEFVYSAKMTGIYSHLLSYIARVNSGEHPGPLPGEQETPPAAREPSQTLTTRQNAVSDPSAAIAKGNRNEKAMNYFQNCLIVLDLEEEVALTDDALRSAYKRAALKAHPDKGGSEQKFESVTRAYAYLTEILRRIKGGRSKEGVVEAPTALKDTRQKDATKWESIEPVRLNPKKLDMNAFNQMYEQTRIPDPDDQGYGDWLKSEEAAASTTKFGGKFNRDVFNRTFEEEAKKRPAQQTALQHIVPQAMVLAPTHGVELGRSGSSSYTAPANAQMKYTDLRQAYTSENTFSNQVSDVRVDSRSFDAYSSSRKKTPDPLTNSEMEAIQQMEAREAQREAQRAVRAAQELIQSDEYFKRMKQMVLTDKKIG